MKPKLNDHLFALLELTTAVIVICLLIVGLVALVRYTQDGHRIDVTRLLVKRLFAAAETYRDRTGELPAKNVRPNDPPEVTIDAFIKDMDALDPALLEDVPAYLRGLSPLPHRPTAAPARVIRDAWGTVIRCEMRREGKPLFISAGANRTFGRDGPDFDDIDTRDLTASRPAPKTP